MSLHAKEEEEEEEEKNIIIVFPYFSNDSSQD